MTGLNISHETPSMVHSNALHGNVGYPRCDTIHQLAAIIATRYGAAAEKSVMNLSAGLFSAAQSGAPPQQHGLSLCTAQGHGLCSEHRDRCGNYLNWRRRKKKKKLQHSWSVTGAGFVWAECELDPLIPGWM